jgi:transposase
MARVWAVRDELWEVARPLLPEPNQTRMGRPRVDDRVAFNAIVFVLVTGIAWRHLPRELGCSPATAHRRLQQWQRAGVWQKLYAAVLQRLEQAGRIDRSTVVIDGSHVRALQGGLDRALAG